MSDLRSSSSGTGGEDVREVEVVPADDAGGEASTGGPPDRMGAGRRLLAVVLLAVNLPLAMVTARALARGWQPLGDNGFLLVRVRDVGTSHHPLLGSWTSASLVIGEDLNNPGPLYLDLVALPVRLLGPWVGLAVGVMLVNIGSCTLAVVAARRISGAASMVAVALAVVGLQFAIGGELLFDIWQPNALLLPCLAFLVIVTVLAAGDLAMAPWVIGVGSLLVQTHLSYAPLVGAAAVAASAAGAWQLRRAGERVRWRRPSAWSAAVAAVAWSQPLIEQVTGAGRGNLTRIAGAAGGGDAAPIGWSRSVRLVGEVVAGAPWFTGRSFDNAIPAPDPSDLSLPGVMGAGPAALVVGIVLAALGTIAVLAWRGARYREATMAVTAGGALAVVVAASATSPVNVVGIAAHQLRWLWPVVAFASAALVAALLGVLRRAAVAQRALPAAAAMLALGALAVVVDGRRPGLSSAANLPSLPAARELVSDLHTLENRGTVLFDASTLTFAEPYSGLVFAELQDQGVPFVFDDEALIRQFGKGRRDDGSADLRLWQVQGPGAREVPEGAERVGFAEGPSGPVALFVEPLD